MYVVLIIAITLHYRLRGHSCRRCSFTVEQHTGTAVWTRGDALFLVGGVSSDWSDRNTLCPSRRLFLCIPRHPLVDMTQTMGLFTPLPNQQPSQSTVYTTLYSTIHIFRRKAKRKRIAKYLQICSSSISSSAFEVSFDERITHV
jgi:hypothetical protein